MISMFFRKYQDAVREGARLHSRTDDHGYELDIEQAIWAGDIDRLQELAHCGCCCADHTFEDCPARVWGGCRGQGTMTRAEWEEWARHYEEVHGMTREQFFGRSP